MSKCCVMSHDNGVTYLQKSATVFSSGNCVMISSLG